MKNKLRIFRAVHRLTQEELAKELGVSRHTIIAIENERFDPSLSLAYRMAGLFGVTIEAIFLHEMKHPPAYPTMQAGQITSPGFTKDDGPGGP
jgi:putative transcriptional regulator